MVLVLVLFSRPGTSLTRLATPRDDQNPNVDAPWIIASLGVTGILAGLVHLHVVTNSVLRGLSIPDLFMPKPSGIAIVGGTSYASLQAGVHLFTQFDWWVTAVAALVFTWEMLVAKVPRGGRSDRRLLWIAIANIVVGPGAAGSFVLAARELRLRDVRLGPSMGQKT